MPVVAQTLSRPSIAMLPWRCIWPLLLTAFGGPLMRRDEPILLQLGVRPCEDERPLPCAARASPSSARIAVYTYNLGGYEEPRKKQVPCAPPEVDAFLFLDDVTRRRAPKAALAHWKRRGWKLKLINLQEGTRYVSAERLTSKYLKFTPPEWMERYDWLIGYDHDMTINLSKLPKFLQAWTEKPLLMLRWYWKDCSDAFDCMIWEMEDMLTKRPEYVRTSRRNIEQWKELMTRLHTAKSPFQPPHYYESCIVARNLKHERASKVKLAFAKAYNMSHDIQRDQFLLPYYLWQQDLSSELHAMHLWEMRQDLDFCSVPTKRKRN